MENDSNALILPAKKRNKRKALCQDKEGFQQSKLTKLSKSEKRKLKKLEEENEKALLLEKSIEAFEKYKIPENAYSLLQSSKNISRVETVKDKRRMAVQFSKAGLEVPHSEKSFKMSTSCEIKDESERIHSRQDMEDNDDILEPKTTDNIDANNVCNPMATYQELVSGNKLGSNAGFTSVFSAEEAPCLINCKPVQESTKNSSLDLSSHAAGKFSELKDKSDQRLTTGLCKAKNLPDCTFQAHTGKPIVVQVARPNEVEEKRRELPIVMMEQEIMEAIYDNPIIIICGETGCGKTTQVPQFLYEAGFGSKQCAPRGGVIGVTQPRRVAVLATARRVSYELGVRLGKEVGFQVRHEKRIGESSAIKFMTDGILLREVQSDFLLKQYSVIILDEAHERSLNTDILIGMLSRIIPQRQKIYEDQQKMMLSGQTITPENVIYPLKLVLMSATLRVEDFISGRRLFRHPPPVIEVPTRQYPVTVHFSKRTDTVDYIGQAYKKVLSIHRTLPQGGILVFVTGQREVEYLCQRLHKASKQQFARTTDRKMGNDNSATFEINAIDGINMKDINDAFNVQENSTDQPTDRFSSYDEDMPYPSDDESDVSYDSETESELEIVGDYGYSGKQSMLHNDDNLLGVLGEEGNIASLKAAFDALSGKTALIVNSEEKQTPLMPEDCLEQSNCTTEKNREVDKGMSIGALHVLPLYAMLPAGAQLRVFEEVKEGERLVVVATNVAETSLTIPGIKYVVDTGMEKTKNYNRVNGMETFETQWISKASAAQRAGRAGRTGPGHCYRLYSSAVFSNILPDFSCPEISKKPADSIVLLVKSMNFHEVVNFPFPTPPETTALEEAQECLKVVEALDDKEKLTPLGKAMVYYPMSPRHSRMLLTVIQIMKKVKNYARANLVLGYAVAAAAALSSSNPFLMQFEGSHENTNGSEQEANCGILDKKYLDKQKKLMKKKHKETTKAAHAKFSNSSSDALTVAYALQCFELSDSQEEFCRENALHFKTMQEMSMLRKQLLRLVFNQNVSHVSSQDFSWTHGTIGDVEKTWRVSSNKNPLLLNEEEVLGRAICAGWADRVAKRIRWNSRSIEGERNVSSVQYEAYKVEGTIILHRWSSLYSSAPELLVYNELLQTKRPYIRGATSVKSEWLVKYAKYLFETSDVDDPRPYYDAQTDQVYHWVKPTLKGSLWQLPLYSEPASTVEVRVIVFACALLEGHVLPCLRSVRSYMEDRPSIIFVREAAGQKRVGNLLKKLETRLIDSCAALREVWEENPEELHSEILHWFKKSFHNDFGELWSQMHVEVKLDPKKRFPRNGKKDKGERIS
ncbi:ATP-dependent RNA helicase DEAH13 [Euphorbia lathyris]|uniref:ATP-dependent RNA helicase DEAH13 n=1 Tax=Euphorbia lathyris TaxID=212925 RepID=UPI0033135D26